MKPGPKKRGMKYVVQRHHISYNPEVVVYVRRTEHWLLTVMGRLNPISKGFIRALRRYIKENKKRAISLKK